MLGAIAGDIIGSVYEHRPVKTTDFPLFSDDCRYTDDTVLTVAVADCIMQGGEYGEYLYRYGRRYPDAGYGGSFIRWLRSEKRVPYGSWGNGSAMRVSPVGCAFDDLDRVLDEARRSAEVTHNHPEGIKGAQAAAAAVYLARKGTSKDEIRDYLEREFSYNLRRTLSEIRPLYAFDVSCQGTVPEAVIAFMESEGYEDAVRKAVSLGGDSDTLACITGAIAHAYYKEVPPHIKERVKPLLPDDLLRVTIEFSRRYGLGEP